MAGRPPDDLAQQFATDTLPLTTHELTDKYEIAESTVREVGYGKKTFTRR